MRRSFEGRAVALVSHGYLNTGNESGVKKKRRCHRTRRWRPPFKGNEPFCAQTCEAIEILWNPLRRASFQQKHLACGGCRIERIQDISAYLLIWSDNDELRSVAKKRPVRQREYIPCSLTIYSWIIHPVYKDMFGVSCFQSTASSLFQFTEPR